MNREEAAGLDTGYRRTNRTESGNSRRRNRNRNHNKRDVQQCKTISGKVPIQILRGYTSKRAKISAKIPKEIKKENR